MEVRPTIHENSRKHPLQILEKPNHRFLFYFGFLLENNPVNLLYFPLQLNNLDPQLTLKAKLLGLPAPNSVIKIFKWFQNFEQNYAKNNKFLGYIRFLAYNGDINSLGQYFIPLIPHISSCAQIKRKLRLPAISLDGERKMLLKLKEIVISCYKKYPQTYEEDRKLLEGVKKLSYNEKNIVMLRAMEKKVKKAILYDWKNMIFRF